eukprot:11021778-Prorocentrum_lima.AAC.1
MTSSLVGSEMCIRDSLLVSIPIDQAGGFASSSASSGSKVLHSPRHTVTVSYTHLTLPTICSV